MLQRAYAPVLVRWHALEPVARGAFLVSAGSMTLVVMAVLVKTLGDRLPSIEILFFRSLIGFFLVMPIFFLSGVLFPLENLPLALTVAMRIDPLTYGIDGLRGALIGTSHFSVVTDLAVLIVVGAGFTALGARAFSKIQV